MLGSMVCLNPVVGVCAALEQILLCNDISIDKLLNRPEEILKLEMFLYNFPKVI